MMTTDLQWMQQAYALAEKAQQQQEVPVGAIVVYDDQLIGQGWNQSIHQSDPSAHAEIVALRAAAQAMNNYRLPGTTLYVTLEPCAMCAGAIIQARVTRVVYGTPDPKTGAVDSVFQLLNHPNLNHRVICDSGIMQQACCDILRNFFINRR